MASNFSEEDVECTICGNQFDEKTFVPKRLNCPHTLCICCIRQLQKPNKSLRCPLCNKDQKIIIHDLATDLATLRLIEVMKYFGVVEKDPKEYRREEEVSENKPLMNVDDLPRELFFMPPADSADDFTKFSDKIQCRPIDYESRGLMKMRFKEGHLQYRFQCVSDISVISGSLYILDTRFARKDTYVHILEPTLDENAIVHDGFQLQGLETGCHGMVSINDHTIAVTNNECHQVLIYTTKGELLTRFGTYGKENWNFRDPRGIFYRNGKLYITDCLNNCISIWTVNGQFIKRIYEEEVIKYPMKIALNFNGDIFIVCCNEYILVYTPDGEYKRSVTHAGEIKLEEIRCIHIDNCGNLLVAGKELEGKNKKKSVWCIDVFDVDLRHKKRIRDQQKRLKFISTLNTARTEDNEDVLVVGDSGKGAVYFF